MSGARAQRNAHRAQRIQECLPDEQDTTLFRHVQMQAIEMGCSARDVIMALDVDDLRELIDLQGKAKMDEDLERIDQEMLEGDAKTRAVAQQRADTGCTKLGYDRDENWGKLTRTATQYDKTREHDPELLAEDLEYQLERGKRKQAIKAQQRAAVARGKLGLERDEDWGKLTRTATQYDKTKSRNEGDVKDLEYQVASRAGRAHAYQMDQEAYRTRAREDPFYEELKRYH